MSPLRRPLTDAPFTEVLTRVAYQLVVYDHKYNPHVYRPFPPTGIYHLAERVRSGGFTNLYWTLLAAAKWSARGYPLRIWRDELHPVDQMRAAHKLRPPRRR